MFVIDTILADTVEFWNSVLPAANDPLLATEITNVPLASPNAPFALEIIVPNATLTEELPMYTVAPLENS